MEELLQKPKGNTPEERAANCTEELLKKNPTVNRAELEEIAKKVLEMYYEPEMQKFRK